jgi:hypothetical protein
VRYDAHFVMRNSPSIDAHSRSGLAPNGKTRQLILIVIGVLISLNLSCKETRQTFADLSALRADLIREYRTENINLTIQNSRVLHIAFVNTAFNDLDRQGQQSKAHQVALFAKIHYRAIRSTEGIAVTFLVQKNYIIFHYTNGLASFYFETRRLGNEPGVADQQSSSGPVIADYNATADNTDVYLAQNLRLYGIDGGGLVALVHFVSPGRKVSEPGAIKFDFTTDSRKKMFEKDARLVIVTNGHVVFSGTARLTSSTGFEFAGSVDQSLAGEIPYQQFVRMAEGRNTTMIVGSYKFELTNEQLTALRAMKRCMENGAC